jgi:hypothetical protein
VVGDLPEFIDDVEAHFGVGIFHHRQFLVLRIQVLILMLVGTSH